LSLSFPLLSSALSSAFSFCLRKSSV
jgi:hypothetical protein